MAVHGIDRIKISVRDMSESVAFFRDTMEMTLAAEAELDGEAFRRLWGLPAGTKVTAAWLKNQEQATMVELLSVSPNSGRNVREEARPYDIGLFDIAFRAADVDSAWADLKGRGFEFLSDPVTYTAEWVQLTVKEVIFYGPNRMPVALIERLSGEKPVIRGRFGAMVDCAQFAAEMSEAAAFYIDHLGYTEFFNRDLPEGLIDEILTLPPGTQSRMGLFFQKATSAPAVELVRCSCAARTLAQDARPDRFGLFALSFRADDLDALLRSVQAAGYALCGGPVEQDVLVHGRVRSAVVRGPGGVTLEFFERNRTH